jgi:hypothetical protein
MVAPKPASNLIYLILKSFKGSIVKVDWLEEFCCYPFLDLPTARVLLAVLVEVGASCVLCSSLDLNWILFFWILFKYWNNTD